MRHLSNLLCLLATILLTGCVNQPHSPWPTDPRLNTVYKVDDICNGITVTDDDRAFVCFPKVDGGSHISIGEMQRDGSVKPYPWPAWNDWKPGDDPKEKFVRTNSLRIGPDGLLYIIDTGTPKQDAEIVKGGPKIVVISPSDNAVVRTIPLDDVCKPKSFIDDLRFNGHGRDRKIYLTDAGEPALIVLDAQSGKGRRVLENDKSTTGSRDMYASGKLMVKISGEHLKMHADQLEVSPDGKTLYFMPPTGPMWAIETKYLDDPNATDLAAHVRLFYDAPTTGGTCIDEVGNIYLSDCNHQRLLRITPDGHATTLIQDARLVWGDALWIDHNNDLWIPAAQLNRSAGLNGGVSKVEPPVVIYNFPLLGNSTTNTHSGLSPTTLTAIPATGPSDHQPFTRGHGSEAGNGP